MKTDRFIKLMLAIIAVLLVLNIFKTNSGEIAIPLLETKIKATTPSFIQVNKTYNCSVVGRPSQNYEIKQIDKDLRPNMHHYYTWKIYDEKGKEEGSNVYNVQGVYKSGLFDRFDNNKKPGHYEWVLKK